MKRVAFLGLGSNAGDREAALRNAIELISETEMVQLISPVYETAPVGIVEQGLFFNLVIQIESSRLAPDLLDRLLAIELQMGRIREKKWGPRNIDIDILAMDGVEIRRNGLVIPHPEFQNRRFVLHPWADIAPDFWVAGASIREHLSNCPDDSKIVRTDVRIPV